MMNSKKSVKAPSKDFCEKLLDDFKRFFSEPDADISIAASSDIPTNHRHCWYEILFYRRQPEAPFQKLLIVPPHTDHFEMDSVIFSNGMRMALDWELLSGFSGKQMICDFHGSSKLLEILILDMEQIIKCRDGNLGKNIYDRHLDNMKKDFYQVFSTYIGNMSHIRREDHIFYAKDYLRTNASRASLQMSEVAAHIGVNLNTLPKLFRKHTGMTARKYLINTRLRYACECMAQYNILLHEVAELSGWNDYSYFVKSFQKQFGITPGKLAAKLKKQEITLEEIKLQLFPAEDMIPR